MDSVGDDAARRAPKAKSVREYRERIRDKIPEDGPEYGRNDEERKASTTRRWKDANPERVREINRRWRAENLDRARQFNRESMRRASERKRRAAEARLRATESSNRWKRTHPEQVREYRRQWVEENREHVREYYRRYHAKNRDRVNARATARRDADPEKTKQVRKAWAERNKDRLADYQRAYRSNPEKYQSVLAANAAAKRLQRRLTRAGLPPRRGHRTTAAERRSNARKATEYFADPALSERLTQIVRFTSMLTDHVARNGPRMREFADSYVGLRMRMGLPAMDAEEVMYARAVQVVSDRLRRVDLLTSRDVAVAVRSAKVAVRQEARAKQYETLVTTLGSHIRRNAQRLHEDARIENIARARSGKPQTFVEVLVPFFAMQEIAPKVQTDRLTTADVQRSLDAVRGRGALALLGTPVRSSTRRESRAPGL